MNRKANGAALLGDAAATAQTAASERRPSSVLPKAYYRPSDAFGARGAGVILGMLIALIAALPIVAAFEIWWAYAILVPLLGASSYKVTILMHECCHRTLFSSRRTNRFVGLVCGALLGASFDVYCRAHWQHHRHCGTDDDSGDNDYLTLQGARPRRLVTHLLTPLTGITFLRSLVADGGPLSVLLRSRKRAQPHVAPTPVAAVSASEGRLAVLLMLGTQGALALMASGFGRWWLLALVYPISAATLGLFFSRVRAFCEHVSEARLPGECSVRTHVPNWFDRCFFYTLHMNLHVEHHLYPQVPACNLPLIHRDLRQNGYFSEGMLSRSIAGTIRRCLADAQRTHA